MYNSSLRIVIVIFLFLFPNYSNFAVCNFLFDSTESRSKIQIAREYFEQRKIDSAQQIYSSILDLDAGNFQALVGMAKTIYQQADFENYVKNRTFKTELSQQQNGMITGVYIERYHQALGYLNRAKKIIGNDTELNYLLGVVQREMVKLKLTENRAKSFENSLECFEKAIKNDSNYKDVFLQLAYLYCNDNDYEKALEFVTTHMKLKPDDFSGYESLIRISRWYYKNKPEKAIVYFNTARTEFNKLFSIVYGDIKEEPEEEINALRNLLSNQDCKIPEIFIRLALVRVYASEKEESELINEYNSIIANMRTDLDADVIFSELKYLAYRDEFIKYYHAKSFEEKRDFIYSFWNRRTTGEKSLMKRIIEHFIRLNYAEDNYPAFRERFSFFTPTDSYTANMDYGDRGLIYIKYGKPDKKNSVLRDENDADVELLNESWYYAETQSSEKRIFHFVGMTKTLAGGIYDPRILSFIRFWDPLYNKLLSRKENEDADILLMEMSNKGKENLTTGISSERSETEAVNKRLFPAFQIYKFRGKDTKSELLIAYFLPLTDIFAMLPDTTKIIETEYGYNIYTADWKEIAKNNEKASFKRDKNLLSEINFIGVKTDTGKINVSIYCNPLNAPIDCFDKFTVDVKPYPKNDLCTGDLMIAIPSSTIKAFGKKWNNLYLLPSPSAKWSLKKQFNIYYEIYNLKKNLAGKTIFRMEYSFRAKAGGENLFSKIFKRSKDETVSTEYTKSGKENSSNEYMSFDLSKLDPGSYLIEVTISDVNAGKQVILSKEVELY